MAGKTRLRTLENPSLEPLEHRLLLDGAGDTTVASSLNAAGGNASKSAVSATLYSANMDGDGINGQTPGDRYAASYELFDQLYAANMDVNPAWSYQGQWAWGQPTGGSGDHGNPDPTSGHTGANVVGYNLSGGYANGMSSTSYVTTGAINCSNHTGVTLEFWRWLGVEQVIYDRSCVQVSANGTTWTTVWQNAATIDDGAWTDQVYDISSVADNQAAVYVRWGLGPTDPSWAYCGWNIDDVTVTGRSTLPTEAVDDSFAVNEDSGASAVGVLANDHHGPGIALTITGKTDGLHGAVAITDGGTGLTYTPAANYYGPDSFTYTIDDGHGVTDTATVTMTVNNVNDNPDAADDGYTIDEDSGAHALDVLANDTYLPDPPETLTITGKTNGLHGGVVTITGGGTGLTYAPAADFYGVDTFTYTISDGHGGTDTATVTMTVNNLQDNPNAVDDAPVVFTGSSGNLINVLANDTYLPDPPETLTVTSVSAPSHGTITLLRNQVLYTPQTSYAGSDSFTYSISDGHGGTDTATASITVLDPPQPRLQVWLVATPVVSGDYSVQVWAQIVNGQADEGISDTSITIYSPGSVGVTAPKQTGTAVTTLWNPDVTDNYYAIRAMPVDSDGDGDKDAVEMSIGAAGYTLPDLGLAPVLLATQTWTMQANHYVPLAVRVSSDSRHWSSDGTARLGFDYVESVGANVGIAPPRAADDACTIQEDSGANSLDVLANDNGGSGPRIVGVGLAAHGTVTFTNDRVFYTPAPDFYGTDSFTYTAGNIGGETSAATVKVTVNNVNDPPSAANDTAGVFSNSGGNVLSVLANDTYLPDSPEALTVTTVGPAGHGIASLSHGLVLYAPTAGYVGSDSFTYTVSDGNGGSATATVSISVIDPPQPRLKVWLVTNPVASGDYSVQVWAQIIHGATDEGISDTSITIYTPGSVGVTVPKQAGDAVVTAWNPSVSANYLTLQAIAYDSDSDGDSDAVEMSLGDSTHSMVGLGLDPVLLATQTWTMTADQPVQLAVSVSGDSRHWDLASGGKVAFDNIQCDGTVVPPWPRGDFNHDTVVDARDIDLLYRNIGANSQYDLTNDSVANQADVDELVLHILHTGYGDADLNRKVNFQDFQALLDHWQMIDCGWAGGDFDGNRKVNFQDFQMLLDYWNPVGFPDTTQPRTVVDSAVQVSAVIASPTVAVTALAPATDQAVPTASTGLQRIVAPVSGNVSQSGPVVESALELSAGPIGHMAVETVVTSGRTHRRGPVIEDSGKTIPSTAPRLLHKRGPAVNSDLGDDGGLIDLLAGPV